MKFAPNHVLWLPLAVAVLSVFGCSDDSASAKQDSNPVSDNRRPAAATTQPVSADMSLPLPKGLTGKPERAAVFFMQNCATCHGTSGDGEGPRAYFINPPPRNFLLPSSRQKLNRPVLFEAISNGRVGTEMPAWNKVLSEQEIADLAEFVFQTFITAPLDEKDREVDSK